MTAQPFEHLAVPATWPTKSLGDVTRVITANATDDVQAEFTAALDQAWAAAKAGDSLEPLLGLVEGWWPHAVFWADRVAALKVVAQVKDIQANGLPPNRQRFGREELAALIERKRAESNV